ncbi:hypothetical protein PUN4_180157 [Paraburkholderia unamae]|nr:hypothetical protein PUN4_180157 [Paraburkholderia unamae]
MIAGVVADPMSALFVIKPRQVREPSERIGISDHQLDAFPSGIVDDAVDFWTCNALPIQRKDCHDGIAPSQCVYHFDYR